jgi:hypothetical protein
MGGRLRYTLEFELNLFVVSFVFSEFLITASPSHSLLPPSLLFQWP